MEVRVIIQLRCLVDLIRELSRTSLLAWTLFLSPSIKPFEVHSPMASPYKWLFGFPEAGYSWFHVTSYIPNVKKQVLGNKRKFDGDTK